MFEKLLKSLSNLGAGRQNMGNKTSKAEEDAFLRLASKSTHFGKY